ncbi:MAG: hypothetical protein ACI9XO_002790 [Paraglaciecola sp.]|jgi:hypothetical protein
MKKNHLFTLLCLPILFAACTKDTGKLQVTYNKATAIYGDLDDVRSQAVNSSVREIDNPGKIYIAEDLILLGEEEQGVHVIDNSDEANPQTVNFINIPGNREYFVKGDFLYAESYYDVVKLDISNPMNVTLVNRAEFVFTEEMKNNKGETLLGFSFEEITEEVTQNSDLYNEIMTGNFVYVDFAQRVIPRSAVPASFAGNSSAQSGTVNRVTHYNGHVYLLGRSDLNIIKDDADFAVVAQQANIGEEMETIFPYENKLFIGSRASMEIYDISNPEAPTQQYFFSHATSCDPVLPADGAAYVSLRTGDFSECPGDVNSLIVLNIENLQNPQQAAEIPMSSPYGMAKIGNYLFVGEGANGLTIFDATNPLDLQQVAHNDEIEAYDILAHPSRTDFILIAGTGGLEQYALDGLDFDLTSKISY